MPNSRTSLKTLKAKLLTGINTLGLSLTIEQVKQILDFIDLLSKWNKIYNLTAITNKDDMLTKHVLDSLSITPYITDVPLLDVGSGAGLPGIMIAITHPNLPITLIDSVGKKCRFIQMALTQLKLDNVCVINDRVESYKPKTCFGQVSARAFASTHKIKELTSRLLCDNGRYLLMKSDKFLQEDSLPKKYQKIELSIPNIDEKHYLILIQK